MAHMYVLVYALKMKALPKSKKPTELRETLFETLEMTVSEDQPFLIEHKAGTSILLSAESHRQLLERIEALRAANQGLQDFIDGRVHAHVEVKASLSDWKREWLKKSAK